MRDRNFLNKAKPPQIATLIILGGASSLATNLFLPSLPSMTDWFDTRYATMQLSVAIYLAFSAVVQLFIGPMSDKWGRRPVLLWGIGIYCIATLGCVLAPNVQVFLLFRMLQAAIAVAMVLSRAIVRDLYPQDRAASMIGYVTMGVSVVPMAAPALGGVIDLYLGWQASFWLLLLVGLLLWVLVWLDLGETGGNPDNTITQQFREYPELLTSPRFWGYCLASALGSGSFFAYLGGAPFVGSVVFHLDPGQLGLYFSAPTIGYFLGNYLSGAQSARIGVNRMVLWGSLLIVLGLGCSLSVSLAGHASVNSFFGFMIIVGVGNGMSNPNATAGMLSVRPHLAATASGLGGAIMIGGGAIMSGLAGILLHPGSTERPLLWIMFATSLIAVLSILSVIRRERRLGL